MSLAIKKITPIYNDCLLLKGDQSSSLKLQLWVIQCKLPSAICKGLSEDTVLLFLNDNICLEGEEMSHGKISQVHALD